MKFCKIISGVVCLACVATSATVPGAVLANAINLEHSVIVNATDDESEYEEIPEESDFSYSIWDDEVVIFGCDRGGDIVIPETIEGFPVTQIHPFAFCDSQEYKDISITSITIPKTITEIGGWSLNTPTLEAIYVDPENPNFSDVDGVLFSKDQKTLLLYPKNKLGKSYSVPNGVTKIGSDDPLGFDSAFGNCSTLETIIIPEGVAGIGYSTFESCSALTSVTIPASAKYIGAWAFANCSSLTSVTILNSAIEIDSSAFEDCPELTSITIVQNTEYQWGDADEDGEVGIVDVVLMNRVYVGVDKISESGKKNADSDQDGKITLSDSMNVLRLLVHLLGQEDFPVQAE